MSVPTPSVPARLVADLNSLLVDGAVPCEPDADQVTQAEIARLCRMNPLQVQALESFADVRNDASEEPF
jgi:hypothetical protein